MAERRMFTKKITESDAFSELPATTQALYFHLCMSADDDGFSNQIRMAMFNAHADRKDLDALIEKKFVIFFEDRGVAVVKHWKMHNYIQKDRYNETKYLEEKARLILKENGVYSVVSTMDTKCIQTVSKMETQVRLDKVSIDKVSLGEVRGVKEKPERENRTRFIPPTLEQVTSYCSERKNNVDPQRFIDFYESKGWMVGKNKMKDWQAAVRTWEQRDNEPHKSKAAQELDDFYEMTARWAKGENA